MSTITPAQEEYLTKLIATATQAVADENAARQGIHATAASLAMNNARNWEHIKGAQAEAADEDVEAAKKAARIEAEERDAWEDEENDDYWFTFYQNRARVAMEQHIAEVQAFTNVDVQSLTKEEASEAIDFLKDAHPHYVKLEGRIIKNAIAEMTSEPAKAEEEPKATHILPTSDFPAEIIKEAGSTDFTNNWIVIAGDTAIIAQTNTDAVQCAARLTGNSYAGFDGSARPGMQRRMKEAIAGYFGIDAHDVKIAQRETDGGSSVWKRGYELANPEKHYGPF